MGILFELLIKFQGSKHKKIHSITKTLKHVFSGTDRTISAQYAIKKMEDVSTEVADTEEKDHPDSPNFFFYASCDTTRPPSLIVISRS